MKFNPLDWSEIKPNAEVKITSGLVQLRCSAPAAVFTVVEGFEALAAHGTEIRFNLPEAATLKVVADKGVRVFKRNTYSRSCEDTSERFTNIDRLPHESGTVYEVSKAVRNLKLMERDAIRRIREAQASAMPKKDDVQVIEQIPPSDDKQKAEK